MSFKRYGASQIGEWVDNNVRQAKHLYSLVAEHPEFEAACEPPMSAICIRYRGADPDQAQSRELHAEVAKRVEQSGKFWFATTELKGKMYFRISPVNFRTRMEHMDQLLAFLEQECLSAMQSFGAVMPHSSQKRA
jgi:L-2,4-diaminobutyrate decarboxylase